MMRTSLVVAFEPEMADWLEQTGLDPSALTNHALRLAMQQAKFQPSSWAPGPTAAVGELETLLDENTHAAG
jgi:hypothetical protein